MSPIDETEKGCLLAMVGAIPWIALLVWSASKSWNLLVDIWGEMVDLLKQGRGR